MTKDPCRIFTAIPIPTEIKAALTAKADLWKQHVRFRKWTHPEDLHITLVFIGETDGATVQKVKALLQRIAAAQAPFTLFLTDPGTFGPPAAPSILWNGVNGQIQALQELQRKIEVEVSLLSFKAEERAYRPHITLARKYAGITPFSRSILQELNEIRLHKEPGESDLSWTCDHVSLYQSHLGRTPMYEMLADYSFESRTIITI